jgi:integrase
MQAPPPSAQPFSCLREALVPALFTVLGAILGFAVGEIRDEWKAKRALVTFARAIGFELDALSDQLDASFYEVQGSIEDCRPRQGTLPHDKYAALPEYIRPVVAIAYATGLRRSEILGLRWSNIKWMDSIIRIEDSKNGDRREIPFGGQLETLLKGQFANWQEGCDFVCYRVNRLGHAQRVGNFRKVSSRACVKLGLGKMEPVMDAAGNPVFEPRRYEHSKSRPKLRYSGLLLHDLRRTFIGDAEHSGAPRHEAMQLSGHKTESVYKRYAISDRENRRAALDQIAAYRA